MDVKQVFASPVIILLFGKPDSGKSHALKYMVTEACANGLFNFGIIFSVTASFSGDFDFIPSKYIINGYNEDILVNYIEKLKKWRLRHNKQPAPPNFIIFDDVVGDLVVSKYFKKFLTTHRHTSTTVFIATQYPTECCGVVAREIISYGLVFRQASEQAIINIYKCFGGYMEKADFLHILEDATKEKYQCLLVNAQETDTKLKFKKYRAPAEINMTKLIY